MSFIHLCPDEKFIDAAWDTFETLAPGQSRYWVHGEQRELRNIHRATIEFVGKEPWAKKDLYEPLREASCVILHSLDGVHAKLVASRLSRGVNFVWVGFGYDYYDLIFPSVSDLYMDLTTETLKGLSKGRIRGPLKALRRKLGRELYKYKRRKAIKRLNYFSPVLESEYNLVKLAFRSHFKFPRPARYNY